MGSYGRPRAGATLMLTGLFPRLGSVLVVVMAAVLFILHRERTAQAALRRASEAETQARTARFALKIKESQDEASASAAHTRPDLLDRLRAGSF